MSTLMLEIKSKIKEGVQTACRDIFSFTDEPSRKFTAEYLLTVAVAKAISTLNGPPGDPYKIYIEKKTKDFARDCLRPFILDKSLAPQQSIFRDKNQKIKRNGRVDIAVYSHLFNSDYLGEQPICNIEIKGFNPQRTPTLADLKRNLEFLRLSGRTGKSVLQFSAFVAIHSFSKCSNEAQILSNKSSIEKKYTKWISELGNIEDVHLQVKTFTVRKETLGRVIDEGDYEILDTDARHHFEGVIIFIQKKFVSPPTA